MSDTLEVFGTEYSNVTGIKATDNNGDIQTYIKPEGTINITTKGLTDVTAYRTANVDTGTSVPDGGATNQVLAKDSNTDGDVTWKTVDKTYVGLGNVDNTSDANKPISTATQTALNGKLSTSLKGANSGLAELDANGKVPSSQLPSFVDDVLEYSAQSSFPSTGETGKIYIAQDTNKTYRWSGTAYVEISASLALGTTSSTAYRGDYGNTAYTHATDSSRSTTAQASGLYKIATTAEGHVASVTAVEKSDITWLGIPAQDTTDLTAMTGTLPIANGGTGKTTAKTAANALIGGLDAWTATPTDSTYFIRQDTSGSLSFGRAAFSTLWTYVKNKISSVLGLTSSTYGGSAAQVNGHTVAADVPSDAVFTDTVYTHPTTSGNKHIPSGGSTGQVLKYSADGTAQWANETAELPSGGSANQVLKKNSSNNGVEWGGYAVPSGGYQGYVLYKTSSTDGSLGWKNISTPVFHYDRYAYTASVDYGNNYQGWYYSWDYLNEIKNAIESGISVTMWLSTYDSNTGETTNDEGPYIVDCMSEMTEDLTLDSNDFVNDEVYYMSISKMGTDGTIERRLFEVVYEQFRNYVWMMKEIPVQSSSSLPSGGTQGQVLVKNSSTDGDVTWGGYAVPSSGTNGQILKRNNGTPMWATLSLSDSGVTTPNGTFDGAVVQYSDNYGWCASNLYREASISEIDNYITFSSSTSEYLDAWNWYINGIPVFVYMYDQNDVDYSEDNPFKLDLMYSGANLDYYVRLSRLSSNGSIKYRTFQVEYDDNATFWIATEIPGSSGASSAVGVNF